MSLTQTLLAPVAAWAIAVISAGGYAGIALLMAIESTGVPLPSELVMPFAGYLVSTGRFDLVLVSTAGALGCNLGSVISYEIARRGGRPLIERYGRYVLLGSHDLDRAERFFARWGGITVLVGRLLPVVRSVIAYPAGLARMPLSRFHLYTFLGSWPWCFTLAWAGMKLGAAWRTDPRLERAMHGADAAVGVAIVAALAWFLIHQVRKRR